MDKYELRRSQLSVLIKSIGKGGIKRVAETIGIDPSYVSRMLYEPGKAGRKRIGEDSLELLVTHFPDAFGAVMATLPAAAEPEETIDILIAKLTPKLQRAPERIRKLVGDALASYALHPEDGRTIARTIQALLQDLP